MDYVSKKSIKKLARELEAAGLVGKAKELRAKMSKVTYEEEASYQALLIQAIKAKESIIKTEWEKKIIDKLGKPDGTATPDCWLTSHKELAEIMVEQDPDRECVDKNMMFGFYTYMGEVCVLTDSGYDCDFDSFPVDFQKKFWELVDEGKYEEEG